MLKALTLTSVLFILASCAGPERRAPDASATASTPAPDATPRPPATPPPLDKNATPRKGLGRVEDYSFTYELRGDQLTAEFAPTRLPHDQMIVVAVARHIISTVYGEAMGGFPRSVAWAYKDTTRAVMLEGAAYDYVFVPLTDEQQKIPTLVFWRVAKGSAG